MNDLGDGECILSASPPQHPVSSVSGDGFDVTDCAPDVAFVPCASNPHKTSQCSIRRHAMFLFAAAALLLCSPSIVTYANASPSVQYKIHKSRAPSALFVSPVSWHSFASRSQRPSMSIQRKTPQQRRKAPNLDTTWSNAVRQKSDLNESRFGVRKRVRSVLDKAKKRTGIENSSAGPDQQLKRLNGEATFIQSGLNIVAETASIGGLEAVVVDDEGRVDVALDYISKGRQPFKGYNGTSVRLSLIHI